MTSRTTLGVLIALASTVTVAGCGGPADAAASGTSTPPGVAVRAVDPCTLLTDAEVKTLIGTGTGKRSPGGTSGTSCTVGDPAKEQVVRVAVFGDPQTAPAVFADQRKYSGDRPAVEGVAQDAFSVQRADEVGIVMLTGKAVVSVSILATQRSLTAPDRQLAKLIPVVRQVSRRL